MSDLPALLLSYNNGIGTDEVLVPVDVVREVADRIEQLERWKDEAVQVLEGWDRVADLFEPRPSDLGRSKHQIVAERIGQLEAILRDTANAVEFEDDRIGYVSVQMDRDVWLKYRGATT